MSLKWDTLLVSLCNNNGIKIAYCISKEEKMKKLSIFILSLLISSFILLGDQSVNLKIGLLNLTQNSDLWEQNRDELVFNKKDMLNLQVGIEYEKYFNQKFSFSLEAGYYEKKHYTQFRDWEYEDGNPIFHNISLEITYLEADFKIYPVGHRKAFYPYLGGGIGIYYWKYVEWGDFIDEIDEVIFEDENAQTSTYTPGFNLKGGFVLRFKGNIGFCFEAKYQFLKGELSSFFEGFEKFDLNGISFSFGFNVFFK